LFDCARRIVLGQRRAGLEPLLIDAGSRGGNGFGREE
jgi:hypothetical protein